MAETISAIVDVGIPVMGHIGLQPQTTMLSQGYSTRKNKRCRNEVDSRRKRANSRCV